MQSIDAFLDALGGEAEVARRLNITLPAVGNWKIRGAIPGGRHIALTELAKDRKIDVPAALFGISSSGTKKRKAKAKPTKIKRRRAG